MKDDLPEEWLPTQKTKGRAVPRSEFLARGPRREVLRGIMEECREATWERMERCRSLLIVSESLSLVMVLLSLLISLLVDEGLGLDQFHVDEHLTEVDERLLLA